MVINLEQRKRQIKVVSDHIGLKFILTYNMYCTVTSHYLDLIEIIHFIMVRVQMRPYVPFATKRKGEGEGDMCK